jgi:hypothetical protein
MVVRFARSAMRFMVMASRWVVVEWTRGSGPRFGERMGMGRGGKQRAPHGGTVNVWMTADSPSHCVGAAVPVWALEKGARKGNWESASSCSCLRRDWTEAGAICTLVGGWVGRTVSRRRASVRAHVCARSITRESYSVNTEQSGMVRLTVA